MNVKPLFDRVIILPDNQGNVTKSGIVLPETLQDGSLVGEVVAIGDGENLFNEKVEMKVKVGDKILFNKYSGTELKLEGNTYLILRQIDIIGVFNDWENYSARRRCKD